MTPFYWYRTLPVVACRYGVRHVMGLGLAVGLLVIGTVGVEARISSKNRYGITPPPPPSITAPSSTDSNASTIDPADGTSGQGTLPASSSSSQSVSVMAPKALSLMEQQWLGTTFPKQPVANRVERLETLLYGQTNSQLSMDTRLKALARTYAKAHPTPPPPPSSSSSTLPPQGHQPTATASTTSTTMGTYVVVDQMEQQVFRQTFVKESLEKRLARLETRVFGAVRPSSDSLFDRTEALKQRVLPNSTTTGSADDDITTTAPPTDDEEANRDGTIQGLPAMGPRLAALEQALLKTAYPQDSEIGRLSRLEMKVFKQVAPADISPQQRLERLEAVASAPQGSGPMTTYGSNNTIYSIIPLLIRILLQGF